jgi:hypothetical protein
MTKDAAARLGSAGRLDARPLCWSDERFGMDASGDGLAGQYRGTHPP